MLQHTLGPDFTEDNWTSELRGLVPGFSPYLGPSLSDFRYEDTSGILTNLWFGTKQKRAWKSDRWPTFHLEVKTTSGSVNEPFHMSSAQLQSVGDVSLADCAVDTTIIRRHANSVALHEQIAQTLLRTCTQ